MSSRKVVVVFGGAGFIGSHLVDVLVQKYDVLVVDNMSTGDERNLTNAKNGPGKLHVIQTDVSLGPDRHYSGTVDRIAYNIQSHFPKAELFAVVNLACPASPVAYQNDPIGTMDVCYLGTKHALQLAEQFGARAFHASTSEIYGDPEVSPQDETYKGSVNTWGLRSCYDEGKRLAETLCFEYTRRGNDVRVVRIFNTFGPRMQMDDGRVISNFVVQALSCKNISIYGDGSQTRSFCYVDDLVRGIVAYLHENHGHPTPINLGNPQERTISETAEFIVRTLCSTSQVVYSQLPQDDPKRRNPDISLAQKILGWSPEISFEEGIRRTIDYFSIKLEQNG